MNNKNTVQCNKNFVKNMKETTNDVFPTKSFDAEQLKQLIICDAEWRTQVIRNS